MTDAELKPCPFCGSNLVDYTFHFDQRGYLINKTISCGICGGSGPSGSDKEECTTAWNRREGGDDGSTQVTLELLTWLLIVSTTYREVK